MDDFKRKPVNRVTPSEQPAPPLQPAQNPQPTNPHPPTTNYQSPITNQPLSTETGLTSPKPKKSKKKITIWSVVGFLTVLILSLIGVYGWYNSQLAPADADNATKKLVTIDAGSTPAQIASTLHEEGLIRNETAFLWYARINEVQNSLQAGSYRLSPSESTKDIVEHLTKGNVDTFSITFVPGTNLRQQKDVLVKAGYTQQEVDAAFAKTYSSPLFEGKPADMDLEGYIFPETYTFGTNTSVEAILEHTFEQFYQVIQQNNLVAGFKAQGLTLYEGIIMASIIQKEAVGGDEKQIAQVFLKRHSIGMALGSDPTYQYITDKLGVQRDINYDSPYNTRRYPGIPPGPIANVELKMLQAVANPADGEYLYFLSGDDDVTYFSNTFEEHERNIVEHCKVKCQYI